MRLTDLARRLVGRVPTPLQEDLVISESTTPDRAALVALLRDTPGRSADLERQLGRAVADGDDQRASDIEGAIAALEREVGAARDQLAALDARDAAAAAAEQRRREAAEPIEHARHLADRRRELLLAYAHAADLWADQREAERRVAEAVARRRRVVDPDALAAMAHRLRDERVPIPDWALVEGHPDPAALRAAAARFRTEAETMPAEIRGLPDAERRRRAAAERVRGAERRLLHAQQALDRVPERAKSGSAQAQEVRDAEAELVEANAAYAALARRSGPPRRPAAPPAPAGGTRAGGTRASREARAAAREQGAAAPP